MTDVCGKSNGKWFSKKLCDLEASHAGWCSWAVLCPNYDEFCAGTSEYNGIAALFNAAGFLLQHSRCSYCDRCGRLFASFATYGDDIAPFGFRKRRVKEFARVCLQCEEVCDSHDKPIASIYAYLAPFLAENKSLTNNTLINAAIAKMQEDIVRLRACLEPELMAGKGAYRCLPKDEGMRG